VTRDANHYTILMAKVHEHVFPDMSIILHCVLKPNTPVKDKIPCEH